MPSPDYRTNPEHYKHLIAKINDEADFPIYLLQSGYKLVRRSAGSMEFHNDKDRIVLHTTRNPMTYFNRNDSFDKGRFFKYLMQRSPNFYKAVQLGLEVTCRTSDLESIVGVKKTEAHSKTLEENYNIVPLRNSSYLRVQRGISNTTLNSPLFKDRIFNAYHVRNNGGKIANIAFPKYDLNGKPKNYILYNKPYRSRLDNQVKKFRLVLNQKDHFLFYSKPLKNPGKIIFGESAIDLLSYHEVYGKPDNFYISFGGNVYQEKLSFFLRLIEPLVKTEGIQVLSIMDNDRKGHEFDLKVYNALINAYHPGIYVEPSFKMGQVSLNIHYSEKLRNRLAIHALIMDEKLTAGPQKENGVSDRCKIVRFSDRLLLEFPLNGNTNSSLIEQDKNLFKNVIYTLNQLYLPFGTHIHKSEGKDWNEDLMASKETQYIKTKTVNVDAFQIADKIELKAPSGPEGSKNMGVIRAIHKTSVSCDFGLQYPYSIPFSAIAAHLKRTPSHTLTKRNGELQKNNNLQNHTI